MRLATLVVLATVAAGQPGTEQRLLKFTHVVTIKGRTQVASVLRSIMGKDSFVDEPSAALTVRGTAASLALGEWLFQELDRRPVPAAESSAFDEFTIPDSNEKVSVFYPLRPKKPEAMAETLVAVRIAASFQGLVSIEVPWAVVMRGPVEGIRVAEWVLIRLDHQADPGDQVTTTSSGGRDATLKIFYSRNRPDAAPLIETLRAIRGAGDTIALALSHSPDAIVVRESRPGRMELATWLFHVMDDPGPDRLTTPHEYRLTDDVEDSVVRVFYLAHTDTPEALQELSSAVRAATHSQRLLTFPGAKALVMRGTPAAIPLAERTIAEKDLRVAPRTAAAIPISKTFAVASVKPSPPEGNLSAQIRPDGINFRGQPLSTYIDMAYSLRGYQLRGPSWVNTRRYDIAAKAAGPVSNQEIGAMLQALLAERFRLTTHQEVQVLQGYCLVVDKKGLKIHPARPEQGVIHRPSAMKRGHMTGNDAPVQELVRDLERALGCPIEDTTHIDGVFDFDLRYAPEPTVSSHDSPDTARAVAPSNFLFDVLVEQLGLRLEKKKISVNITVVDHADKVPTEN
ncbi:MAG TPA: TIGR03435 family protein [Bryobacteraceae bacterium]|nr:TIGR03435 family protein [Bryobacteraceae bacterium]